jgi:iron complex outermembrane recepter protein
MGLSGRRGCGFGALTAISAAALAATTAHAQSPRRGFDVTPQTADTALVRFAQQAGIQILAPTNATQGRRIEGLQGEFTVEDGLRALVAQSRLRIVSFDGRTAVLGTGAGGTAFRRIAYAQADQSAPTPNAGAAAAPAPTEPPGAQPPAADDTTLQDIIVTGNTSGKRTLFNSSSNVTLASNADLQRKAPRSTAETLELVPGIFVEGTAGPASNNYSVRGLRGGAQTFIQIEEDGLPILYGGGGADFYFQQDLTIDRLEAVEGGTSGILAPNGAGATINFISLKPNFDRLVASARVTGTTYDDYKAEAYVSSPLTENLAFNIGGYVSSQHGQRHSPFAYRSYQVKAMLEHRFTDGGFIRATIKRRDEHDPYYASMPFAVDADGKIGNVPGLNLKYDNILGEAFRRIDVPDSPATGNTLRPFRGNRGIHTTSTVYRLDLEKPVSDQITVFARGRYLDGKYDFNAIFPGSGSGTAGLASAVDYLTPGISPVDARLQAGLAAFPGTVRFGLRDVQTGAVTSVNDAATLNALNGNGLLQQTVLNHQTLSTKDFGSDFGLRWDVSNDRIENSLTVGGMYYNVRRHNDQSAVATLINDVTNNSHIYDLVALDGSDAVLGQLTNNGMLSYGDWGQGIFKDEVNSYSAYFNDELTIGDRLHIDFGARHEWQKVRVDIGNTAETPAPVPPGTPGLALTVGSTFDGTYTRSSDTFEAWAYTAGANYEITRQLSVYVRGARGFQTNGGDTGGVHGPTKLDLYEGGLRFQTTGIVASLVAFRTVFKNQSYQFINPDNPAVQANALANNKTNGIQLDADFRPVSFFSLSATGVYQDPKLSNLRFDGVEQPQYAGNTPERTPKKLLTLTPSFILPNDLGEIYGRWKHIGKIYADSGNGIALPSYDVFSIGASVNVNERINVSVSIDNLTNVKGFTEGNPRQGQTQEIVNGFFYGRAIAGRNALASVTVKL